MFRLDSEYTKAKTAIDKKNILIISHDSLLGGATIALLNAACSLRDYGYEVVWLCECEGDMLSELERYDISYIVDPTFRGDSFWLKYASNFDLVICNTVSLAPQVEMLKNSGKKVVWWVHEASDYYVNESLNALTKANVENLYCFCVGIIAKRNFEAKFTYLHAENMLYGMPDYATGIEDIRNVFSKADSRTIFLSIGTIEKRKGQDILTKAIRKIPSNIMDKCFFAFVGKPIDRDIYSTVTDLCKDYPNNVIWHEPVDRNTVMRMYKQADVVLCSSREDPMPVFVTEAMMQSKAIICSENTGSAGVLSDGIDALIYSNNDPTILSEKIIELVSEKDLASRIGREARHTYEKHFSMEMFHDKFVSAIKRVLEEK